MTTTAPTANGSIVKPIMIGIGSTAGLVVEYPGFIIGSTNNGTSGYYAKWNSTQTIGNGLITDNGSTVTVLGNLSATGTIYGMASSSNSPIPYLRGRQTALQGMSLSGTVAFNTADANLGLGYISLNTSTGIITLSAGYTYSLKAEVPAVSANTGGQSASFGWVNTTTGVQIGSVSPLYGTTSNAAYLAFGGMAQAVITPVTTTNVALQLLSTTASTIGINGNTDFSTNTNPWFEIEAVGLGGVSGYSGYSGYSGAIGSLSAANNLTVTGYVSAATVSAANLVITNSISVPTVASSYITVAILSGDTVITNGVDRIVPFVASIDPNSWYNSSNFRFTPTIAGYYNVSYQVWWYVGSTVTNQTNIQFRKNGSTQAINQTQILSGNGYSQNQTKIVYLNGSTDYMDFTVYTGNPTSQSIQQGGATGQGTYFSAFLISK